MKNKIIIYSLLFPCCLLLSTMLHAQQKVKLDKFTFFIAEKYKLVIEPNDENVHLTLSDPKGNAIIIQNKLNILKTTLYPNLGESETLKAMHAFKFRTFIQEMQGYDVGEIKLGKIGKIPYSIQSFQYKEGNIKLVYDIRIIQVKDSYYAIYCFGRSDNKSSIIKTCNDLLTSLSKENF